VTECKNPHIRRKATGVTFLALPYGNKAAHSGSIHNTMNESLSLFTRCSTHRNWLQMSLRHSK